MPAFLKAGKAHIFYNYGYSNKQQMKPTIAYHASHEQFSPSALLKFAVEAEKAGFQAIHCSDHFHPWTRQQGNCGFSFAWLGAAMQAVNLSFGVVCAPGQRYHPAIVAQAAATLSEMFPNRFWMSLGSGEAINECITGDEWPDKSTRNVRLGECAYVIKSLLKGEQVSHVGEIKIKNARLFTLPETIPPIMGAALSAETAAVVASWGDGLITTHRPVEELKEIIAAFRRSGGANKPLYLKVALSYSDTENNAMIGAYEQWRANLLPPKDLADIENPEEFEEKSAHLAKADMHEGIHISADPQKHIEWIKQYAGLGFEKIILHNVNTEQEKFIKDFGQFVLPNI